VSNWAIRLISVSILYQLYRVARSSPTLWATQSVGIAAAALLAIVPLGVAFLLRWLRWPQLVRPLICVMITHQLFPFFPWLGMALYWVWMEAWASVFWLAITFPLISFLNFITLYFSVLVSRVAWRTERSYWEMVPRKERLTLPPVMLVTRIVWLVSVVYVLGLCTFIALGILLASGQLEVE
jgi:hypothetical protein